MNSLLRLTSLTVLLASFLAPPAIGQLVECTWDRAPLAPSFWVININQNEGPSNWSGCSDFTFPSNGLFTPKFSAIIDDGSSVIVNPILPIAISRLEMSNGSSVQLLSGTDFLLQNVGGANAGIVDGGEIQMNSAGGSFFSEFFMDGNIQFTGGGTLQMDNSANNVIRGNSTTGTVSRMNLVDYTVRGAGNIGFDEILLEVSSTSLIDANRGTPLTINPLDGATSVFNNGIMQASNGGTLRLLDGGFQNNNVIQALGSGVVEMGNITMRGGTFAGDGTIRLFGQSTLVGPITNDARFEIGSGHRAIIDGDLINKKEFVLGPTGDSGEMILARDTQLTGGGTIRLSDNAANVIGAVFDTSARLTNVDNTIEGSGSLGASSMRLTNETDGIIRANQSTALFVQPQDADGGTINRGLMEAVEGGTLVLNVTTVNNLFGQVRADNGTVRVSNSGTIDGGTVGLSNGGVVELANGTIDSITSIGADSELRTTFGINNRLTSLVNNQGKIVLQDDTRLKLDSAGDYTNAGTIELNGDGALAGFAGTRLVIDGIVHLKGGGDIAMSNASSNTIESEVGNTGILVNDDHRIHGSGHIGRNTLRVTNRSIIEADQAFEDNDAFGTIMLDPGAGEEAFINEGIVRASNGGKISLLNGIYQNQGGLIEAQADSELDFQQAAEIRNGIIRTTGTGLASVNGQVTFENTTLDANIEVNNPIGRLNLVGEVSNKKNISLNQSNLHIRDTVTLEGGGNIVLSPDGSSGLVPFSSSLVDHLVNEDNTISGAGRIAFLAITNRGSIRSEGPTDFIYQVAGAGFDNQGLLHVAGPGEMHMTGGNFLNSGQVLIEDGTRLFRAGDYVQSGGSTIVNGVLELSFGQTLNIQGGKLGGSGLILGAVNVEGTVGAGNSIGILNLQNQSSFSGLIDVELGGTLVDGSATDLGIVNTGSDPALIGFDQINVFDSLVIADGTQIDVSLVDGFQSNLGDFFDILTADQISLAGSVSLTSTSGYEFSSEVLNLFDASTGMNRDVFRLTTVSVPEPAAASALCLLGLCGAFRRKRSRGNQKG